MRYSVITFALMSTSLISILWSGAPTFAVGQPEGSGKWDRVRELSHELEMNPIYNLEIVSRYLDDLFHDAEMSRIFFSDYPESTSSLRSLVRALTSHAKQACDRGDWKRGERAFGLAIRLVRGVLQLKPPEKISIGREPNGKEIYVPRGAALVHANALASAAVFLITERLQQIAGKEKQRARYLQRPLQRAREIGAAQHKHASKILPLLRKGDYRQIDTVMGEHLSTLRSLIDKWEREIMQSLHQIQTSLSNKTVQ